MSHQSSLRLALLVTLIALFAFGFPGCSPTVDRTGFDAKKLYDDLPDVWRDNLSLGKWSESQPTEPFAQIFEIEGKIPAQSLRKFLKDLKAATTNQAHTLNLQAFRVDPPEPVESFVATLEKDTCCGTLTVTVIDRRQSKIRNGWDEVRLRIEHTEVRGN